MELVAAPAGTAAAPEGGPAPCRSGAEQRDGGGRQRRAPRSPQREGRCCLPGLASVRAAPAVDKARGGGRQERRGGLGLPPSARLSPPPPPPPPVSPRLAPPGRAAPGAVRGSGPGRAGGGGHRAPCAAAAGPCHRAGLREEPAPRRASGVAASRSALRAPASAAAPRLPGGEGRARWGAARSVRTWDVFPPQFPRPRCQPGHRLVSPYLLGYPRLCAPHLGSTDIWEGLSEEEQC